MPENVVTLVGNATRDPELSFSKNGNALAAFGIAINTRKKNAAGEWENGDPQFYDVKVFGDLAENVAESIARGNRVVVTGRLNFNQWETDSGDKRSKVEVIADEVGPSLRWATAVVTKSESR